jgi:hypothetical protein
VRPHAPISVLPQLVPVPLIGAPDGFTVVSQTLTGALPLRIPLFADVVASVVVPTGLGRQWGDRAPTDVVSSGENERRPLDSSAAPVPDAAVRRASARLFLERGSVTTAIVPLAAGFRAALPAGGDALVELFVVAWEIRTATVRDGGDVGSRLTLAWRDLSHAPAQFSPEPIHPHVAARRRLRSKRAPQVIRGGTI